MFFSVSFNTLIVEGREKFSSITAGVGSRRCIYHCSATITGLFANASNCTSSDHVSEQGNRTVVCFARTIATQVRHPWLMVISFFSLCFRLTVLTTQTVYTLTNAVCHVDFEKYRFLLRSIAFHSLSFSSWIFPLFITKSMKNVFPNEE